MQVTRAVCSWRALEKKCFHQRGDTASNSYFIGSGGEAKLSYLFLTKNTQIFKKKKKKLFCVNFLYLSPLIDFALTILCELLEDPISAFLEKKKVCFENRNECRTHPRQHPPYRQSLAEDS